MPATLTTQTPRAAGQPLTPDQLRAIDAYWRASLYLCVGMLYLRANPLLKDPLRPEHIKRRLLGHWGSDPGQTLVLRNEICRHQRYAYETGEDMPEITNWKWPG